MRHSATCLGTRRHVQISHILKKSDRVHAPINLKRNDDDDDNKSRLLAASQGSFKRMMHVK